MYYTCFQIERIVQSFSYRQTNKQVTLHDVGEFILTFNQISLVIVVTIEMNMNMLRELCDMDISCCFVLSPSLSLDVVCDWTRFFIPTLELILDEFYSMCWSSSPFLHLPLSVVVWECDVLVIPSILQLCCSYHQSLCCFKREDDFQTSQTLHVLIHLVNNIIHTQSLVFARTHTLTMIWKHNHHISILHLLG